MFFGPRGKRSGVPRQAAAQRERRGRDKEPKWLRAVGHMGKKLVPMHTLQAEQKEKTELDAYLSDTSSSSASEEAKEAGEMLPEGPFEGQEQP